MNRISSPKIFTTGYTGKDIAQLKPLVESLNAVLIDIRFSPISRQIEWRKDYLQLLLKNRYRNVQNLGNRSYKDNKIEIQNLSLGIKTILSFEINLILMCSCENLHQCHRFLIMNELKKMEYEVEELENWKIMEPSLF